MQNPSSVTGQSIRQDIVLGSVDISANSKPRVCGCIFNFWKFYFCTKSLVNISGWNTFFYSFYKKYKKSPNGGYQLANIMNGFCVLNDFKYFIEDSNCNYFYCNIKALRVDLECISLFFMNKNRMICLYCLDVELCKICSPELQKLMNYTNLIFYIFALFYVFVHYYVSLFVWAG